MRWSQLYAPTLREVPAEAELASHQLMLRAGMMRRSAAGVYTYLPLGLRVIQKIEAIIREELNKSDSQEVLLPIIQPAELWHETGRWDDYGDEMFKLSDRNKRQFCLGPTHEEIITALVRSDVNSYKQLPLRLYQIQNKYRDEIRPRFGVIRGREFIMKDCYSFDKDEAGLNDSYYAMYDAYNRIFARCGLDAKPVEADSGAIGGDSTHEFMVLGDAGEAEVVYCKSCDYAANVERAECIAPEKPAMPMKVMGEVHTPSVTTIEQLTEFLRVDSSLLIKTMIYLADKKPVAVLVGGNHTVNEIKLQKVLECNELELADTHTITTVTNAPVGYAGPVGLEIPIIVDLSVTTIVNGVTGANKADTHFVNVNFNRDFMATKVADVRQAESGDKCSRCSGTLTSARGTEVGQVFKLGTKYSMPLKATFLDEQGKEKPLIMGCYGIGVSRTVAAIIDQHHDQDGICWPVSVTPYEVIVVPVSYKDESQSQVAENLYEQLKNVGFEVLLDDRNERPGVKFKDADLIGCPFRITIGPKHLKNDNVELVIRKTKQTLIVPVNEVVKELTSLLSR